MLTEDTMSTFNIKDLMIPAFKNATGGLFSKVEKADVGGSYQELEKQGVALMGWADPFMPDQSLPKHIEEAWIAAIKDTSAPHYTAPIGNETLKQLIAEKFETFNKVKVDPNRNVLITPGSDSGLFFAMVPFINPGDEILVPTPCYPNNLLNISIMGGTLVSVPLNENEAYQISEEVLNSYITPKTKMLVLTHPNNPTTTVYNQQSLDIIARCVIKNNLVLVCDQAFEDFCYDVPFISPASLPDMFERTITVCSFSKGMGLSGLRVAYIVCSDVVMDTLHANAVSVIGATNTASQHAIIAALSDTSFMDEFRDAFEVRRKAAYEIINSIPNVSMQMPESGFLGWVNISKLGSSSEIVAYLLNNAKVSVNDGINYGVGGEGHFRIVLGVYRDNQRVIDALNRIKHSLIQWQEEKHCN